MSYILEALKKSEQERKRGDVPDLQTVHLPVFAQSQSNKWPYVVIVFLLLVLAFVLGMVMKRDNDKIISETPQINVQVPENTTPVEQIVEPAVVVPPVMQIEQVVETESVSVAEPVVNRTIEQTPSLEMNSAPLLTELPSLIQQGIPKMTFAGHVYSSNPSQRSVIINGNAMGEGDVIMNNLRVEQITRSGVVFNFEGRLFRIDILQDWSFE
ncbi:MAG TPA: general secretion pathway protein GspB [Gammaproteobacteria bacterium]